MPEKVDSLSKSAQSLPGTGCLADMKLASLMSRAPVGDPEKAGAGDGAGSQNANPWSRL